MIRFAAGSWLVFCAVSAAAIAEEPIHPDARLRIDDATVPAAPAWALFADKKRSDLDLPDANLDNYKGPPPKSSDSGSSRPRRTRSKMTTTVALLFGSKELDDGDWVSNDHTSFGVDVIFQEKRSRTGWVIGYQMTDGSGKAVGLKEETETQEILFGIRDTFKIKQLGPIRAGKNGIKSINMYLNGGVAFISLDADIDALGVSDSDSGVGFWVGGGLYIKDRGNVMLGIDVKYSDADVSLSTGDYAAGGFTWAIMYGFSF